MTSNLIDALKTYDSATLFNALALKFGLPNEEYTSHEIRCLLPDLGTTVGYAVTAEVTTNDPDSPALEWIDYYEYLDSRQGPLIAMFQDVDSRPGRGACFGDGMARIHKRLGVAGVVVGGTIRDLAGIRQVGIPVWAWGTVPGHGVFHVVRYDTPVTVGQLRVHPGDLLVADTDGCVRIPPDHVEEILRLAKEVRSREAELFELYESPTFSVQDM